MDIVPFITSCVLDSSKVTNRHYLKTVKSMDYDEFCDVIASVIPELSITLPLFHCDEWYEFVSFTTIQQSRQDEEYVVRDCKVEYPITLVQLDHQQWKLEGIAPHCLSMFTHDKHNGVLNIPLVIEANKTSSTSRSTDLYHQTVLVFDFRQTKHIAFLYDPNGECSRFNTDDVHYAIETYVNMLDVGNTTSPIKYKRLHNNRINLYHKSIGGENCVVCCILFMISYSLLRVDVCQHDAMFLQSKTLSTKLHILLYNALGYELQRFTT
jgi:hypothetical protein